MNKLSRPRKKRTGTAKLARIVNIIGMLRRRRLLINCSELSKKFDVDRVTILRDIKYLNNEIEGFGVKVEYDRETGTYKYPDGESDKIDYLDVLAAIAPKTPSHAEYRAFLKALTPPERDALFREFGYQRSVDSTQQLSSGVQSFASSEYFLSSTGAIKMRNTDKLIFLIEPLRELSREELTSIFDLACLPSPQ